MDNRRITKNQLKREGLIVRKVLFVLIAGFLAFQSVAADESSRLVGNATSLGFKGGIIGRGNFEGEDTTKTKIGSSFGLFATFPVGKYFRSGMAIDFHNILVLGKSAFMMDVSFTWKFNKYFANKKMALRPAVAVGYGLLSQFDFMTSSKYLTLKAWLELTFFVGRKNEFLIEAGVWRAPTGGLSGQDIDIGPSAIFRVGFVP